MKNAPYLVFFCFFLFFNPLYSQELEIESSKQENIFTPHQIGLSIGINKDVSAAYRKILNTKIIFRSNLNTKLNSTFIDASITGFQLSIELSTGFERHNFVSKKINLYYGAEAKFSTSIYSFRFNRNVVDLAGLAGLKFRLNKRIAIFSEAKFGLETLIQSNTRGILSRTRPSNDFNLGILYTLGKMV